MGKNRQFECDLVLRDGSDVSIDSFGHTVEELVENCAVSYIDHDGGEIKTVGFAEIGNGDQDQLYYMFTRFLGAVAGPPSWCDRVEEN
jgi:hypothetical protein